MSASLPRNYNDLSCMSLKSGIWVDAHIRRCQAQGLMAFLVKRGAEEAGAVYVRAIMPGGLARLFGPAPGPAYNEEGLRSFALPLGQAPVRESQTQEYLDRQRQYDPDIWLLDVEDPEGYALLLGSISNKE